jgi:low affinity Fe/Cu permease
MKTLLPKHETTILQHKIKYLIRDSGKEMLSQTKIGIHKTTSNAILNMVVRYEYLRKKVSEKLEAAQMILLRHFLGVARLSHQRNIGIKNKFIISNII